MFECFARFSRMCAQEFAVKDNAGVVWREGSGKRENCADTNCVCAENRPFLLLATLDHNIDF